MIKAASKQQLAHRNAEIIFCPDSSGLRPPQSGRGDVRRRCVEVHDEPERRAEGLGAGASLDCLGRQVPAEGARAGHAAEQAEHVPGHRAQAACRARARARYTG